MFPAGLAPARALAATRFLRGRNRPARRRAPCGGRALPSLSPAWAVLQLPRPPGRPPAAVGPRAHGSASSTYLLHHARQALDSAPRRAPGRAAGEHHGQSGRHRQAATPREGPSREHRLEAAARGDEAREASAPAALRRAVSRRRAPASAPPSPPGGVCAGERLSFPPP